MKDRNEARKGYIRKLAQKLSLEQLREISILPKGFLCYHFRKDVPNEERFRLATIPALFLADETRLDYLCYEWDSPAYKAMNASIRYPKMRLDTALALCKMKRKIAGKKAYLTKMRWKGD